jgi:hypothetical protein
MARLARRVAAAAELRVVVRPRRVWRYEYRRHFSGAWVGDAILFPGERRRKLGTRRRRASSAGRRAACPTASTSSRRRSPARCARAFSRGVEPPSWSNLTDIPAACDTKSDACCADIHAYARGVPGLLCRQKLHRVVPHRAPSQFRPSVGIPSQNARPRCAVWAGPVRLTVPAGWGAGQTSWTANMLVVARGGGTPSRARRGHFRPLPV